MTRQKYTKMLYVDDMLIAMKKMTKFNNLKIQLNKEFDMKNLDPTKKVLDVDIIRDRIKDRLTLSQRNNIKKLLVKFRMENTKLINILLVIYF
uniref:Reverse transcriptase Ty1/copia-type domain-containing protein n=1 Tax=Physcomitrium patens TaxID=3218 RepID=A0A2K1IV68_PHYPA|nr:hypothetical protein PHYPA_025113 [Physcomitrium patens]